MLFKVMVKLKFLYLTKTQIFFALLPENIVGRHSIDQDPINMILRHNKKEWIADLE